MMNKINRVISMLLIPALLAAMTIGCNNDEAITFSVQDVSSKVTGFSKDVTGPGAELSINGTDMDKVARVFIGEEVITRSNFVAVSPSSVTFNVPLEVSLGENDVLIVFDGNGRAFKTISVVALPAISSFNPATVAEGETVTILGTNLGSSYVTAVNIGGAAATITSQSNTALTFTVPAGFSTNKITLASPGGDVNSATNLTNCADDPNNINCKPALNLNSGFELGDGDEFTNWEKWNGGSFMVATTVPGEFYSGNRALKVIRDGSLGDGQWRIQLASAPADWQVGASYTVHLWARASATGGSLRVSTNPNAMYTGDQAVPTTWTRLSFTFPAANEASSRIVLDLNGNNTAVTTFYIDDVKLIKD